MPELNIQYDLNIPGRNSGRPISGNIPSKADGEIQSHPMSDLEKGENQHGKPVDDINPALAEELLKDEERGNGNNNEPDGCWDIMTRYISSVWYTLYYLDTSKETASIS